jgi:monomeric phenylalanine-4-hydroxylase
MDLFSIDQDYSHYKEEDHLTWQTMCGRQTRTQKDSICVAYLEGFEKLQLDHCKIPDIGQISKRLHSISGWTLIPVAGLIPTMDFFTMLVDKKYPITVSIRKSSEIDFIDRPDIFHDVCGHVPLLTNLQFVNFLARYSKMALKYLDNEKAIDILGRLYWFTCEMGVILEKGGYKAYGGAIITSAGEIANVNRENIPKYPFTLSHILGTAYDYNQLQTEYFVINSFDELFNSLVNLEETLIEQLHIIAHSN